MRKIKVTKVYVGSLTEGCMSVAKLHSINGVTGISQQQLNTLIQDLVCTVGSTVFYVEADSEVHRELAGFFN